MKTLKPIGAALLVLMTVGMLSGCESEHCWAFEGIRSGAVPASDPRCEGQETFDWPEGF
ncbi:MAG: hypothetical protein ACR2PJ_03585 [Pseudomonadales bacterium]